MVSDSHCTECRGRGVVYPPDVPRWEQKEHEIEVTLEFEEQELVTISCECDQCGADLMPDILEELKCQKRS